MIGIGGADETIKRDVVEPRDLLIAGRKRVDERPSLLALRLRGAIDLGPVLVGAGEEEDLITALPMEACKRVGADLLVDEMQTGSVVHVHDGGG